MILKNHPVRVKAAQYRVLMICPGPGVQGVVRFLICAVDPNFSNFNVHTVSGGSCENAFLIQIWGESETLSL